MSCPASYGTSIAIRVALVTVFVAAAVGCGKGKGPPPLPKIPTFFPARPSQAKNEGLDYRRRGGQDIAPVVIADEPAPTSAEPGASNQGGAHRPTLNGDPNGITRETLNRSIQGAMGSLAACFTNITQDPMVAVSFEADPSGRPSLVRVNGAPSDAERCIRNIVQNIRFPSFEGKGVQVDLPLSFHSARPTQVANPTGEQPAAAPPLFLEP
jgi:hypothetical protein